MDLLFFEEDRVIREAEDRLASGVFDSVSDADNYRDLLGEYRKLLSMVKRVVKISDLMQDELSRLSQRLEQLSRVDALTGVANRRHFSEVYQSIWMRSREAEVPLSVLMMDIDFFKAYNDIYGHPEGDLCLKRVAGAMAHVLDGSTGFLARYGGEEFVVLLPDTDVRLATDVARRMKDGVEHLGIPHSGAPAVGRVTISVGVASRIPDEFSFADALINAADAALYEAKNAGRNQVRVDGKLVFSELNGVQVG